MFIVKVRFDRYEYQPPFIRGCYVGEEVILLEVFKHNNKYIINKTK